MTTWQAEVRVWLKSSVFDPQGAAVEQALRSLGHDGVEQVRIGKYMVVTVRAASEAAAAAQVRAMCEELLCNPVMETYAFTLRPVEAREGAETAEGAAPRPLPAGAAGGAQPDDAAVAGGEVR